MPPGRRRLYGPAMLRRLLLLSLLLGLSAGPSARGATAPMLGLTETGCDDFTTANADFEAYGPTDVNAQAGDQHVTVGENTGGTVTVFKWPNPSYYNQVKYVAVARDAAGRPQAQFPNEGAFFGIRYTLAGVPHFAWLRDWKTTQRYDSTDTAVPVTTSRSPRAVGLTVRTFDVASGNTLQRELWVARRRSSPARDVQLVGYENFNPVANRIPYLPIADWCLSQASDQAAAYDRTLHAILNTWSGSDQATGRATSVALAMGWDGADTAHEVGSDGYDPAADRSGPADPYSQLARAPYRLGGADAAGGQTTGALAVRVRLDRHGRAAARFTVAAASTPAAASAALSTARRRRFAAVLRSAGRSLGAWLSRTRLPRSADRRVVMVAKRSLISLRLAMVPGAGSIVASADTQGPYGEDWIRDGAFFNEVLDANGYTGAVTKHNLFYARVQTSSANPSPLRPPGNWPMASYGDGIDGAPVPWEIDETGLGIWTLYRHVSFLSPGAAHAYLASVYPAISRAGDFLALCQDPTTGLQCPASEDDNYTPSQSLHGAETTVLGLRSAIAAAKLAGDNGAHVTQWKARLTSLLAAIEKLYDPQRREYSEGNTTGNAYDAAYEDGGWLLWPVELKPAGDPVMRDEALAVQKTMDASFKAPAGEYESRGLLGLAHQWSRPTPDQRAAMQHDLSYTARSITTPTGLLGEAWKRYSSGRPQPVEDMPHVWEHALFYLTSLQIDGARHYRFQGRGVYATQCARHRGPRGACAP